MKNQYVILTGSVKNAGDYLIKYRAKQLFSELKPDVKIIDYDGWKKLNDRQLSEINDSKLLILLGGPAVQKNMYPKVYGLVNNLDSIQVPMITMGVGWYSQDGDWEATYNLPLSDRTHQLLERINNSNIQSSVRDYHTLNALRNHGYQNFIMTGCPALYALENINNNFEKPNKIKKVGFSAGVAYTRCHRMFKQLKELCLALNEFFRKDNIAFDIVFHHPTDEKEYFKAHNANSAFFKRQSDFIGWLNNHSISFVDVSGGAENLIDYYSKCDLQIGFRVHAHIFMNSISKPSILLNEDGRGKALKDVIGGLTFDTYKEYRGSLLSKILRKLNLNHAEYIPYQNLPSDLVSNLQYESKSAYPRMKVTRRNIDYYYEIMSSFICNLP